MPTNEERRKVAQKLRNSDIERHQLNPMVSHATVTICGSSIVCIDEESLRMALDYLADLIEPEPERTCRATSCRDYPDWGSVAYTCSECGEILVCFDFEQDPPKPIGYCPNCGAKVVE